MTKISRVKCCLRLPRNAEGRDFVVGDLHGHRSLFESELERLDFDPLRDRVLSVGDLIDRGPDSLATLSLIDEPWFHAVLGNHELMLLNYLHAYGSRLHSRKSYSSGSSEWVGEAIAKNRKTVARLADHLASLALSIHVEGDMPFNVAHADLPDVARCERAGDAATVSMHDADDITCSRENIGAALKTDLTSLQFEQHSVQISPTPLNGLPITYAGHSRVRDVTVHNSFVYIDQGVCLQSPKRPTVTPPTVLDHGKFAYWLDGVATAKTAAANETAWESGSANASSFALA